MLTNLQKRNFYKKFKTFIIVKKFTDLTRSQRIWFGKKYVKGRFNGFNGHRHVRKNSKLFLIQKNKNSFFKKGYISILSKFKQFHPKIININYGLNDITKNVYSLTNLHYLISKSFDNVRNHIYINKFHKRKHYKIWNSKRFFRFYAHILFSFFKFLKNKNNTKYTLYLQYFYKKFSIRTVLNDTIRFAYLKRKLKRLGKRFILRTKKNTTIKLVSFKITEDLLFFNAKFQKFLIQKGFAKKALKTWSKVLLMLKFRYKGDFLLKLVNVLENTRPLVSFQNMHIGGKKYKIPIIMFIGKSYLIAMRWLKNIARTQDGDLSKNLFNLIEASLKSNGALIKYRNDYHNLAIENKTYIRFLRFLKS